MPSRNHSASKRLQATCLAVICTLALAACTPTATAGQEEQPTASQAATIAATASSATNTPIAPTVTVAYDSEDREAATTDASDVTTISLQGDAATIKGAGATVADAIVTITAAGTYHLSGTLDDGQIIVNTKDEASVVLILDGVDITSATSAPIYVKKAEKVIVTLATGSDNRLTDGAEYILDDVEEGEPNAALFSKSDLTINGDGALTVTANYNDGIASKDGLKITGGTLAVTAVGDGLRGRDYVALSAGQITIDAGKDGVKSTNDKGADKGFVLIEGGILHITAGEDGIQAETTLSVQAGAITVATGGGSANASSQAGQAGNTWGKWPGGGNTASADSDEASAKGLKAGGRAEITGGAIRVDSSDDAVHANDTIAIGGGELALTSGDDGIHADTNLTISGGTLAITQSYEGIESAEIVISGGTLHIVASDDGINVSGGADGSALGGRPGQNTFGASSNQRLEIVGGYIVVDAAGDGIDVNGGITMTAGTVLVNGPTNSGNGALDYMSGFQITGGLLVAVGSTGMAQAPDTSSTQYAVMVNLSQVQPAGTLVHIAAQDGATVLTFAPTKEYQSVAFSSPDLQEGVTYTISTGGSSEGEAADGLYRDGAYTGGTEQAALTISDIITGTGGGGGMQGGPGGGGGRPGR